MSVVDKIQHYQRSLERCTDNRTRTLHCIEKLYRLPVTVQHLQETGVGRTVNALRKYDGSIGDAAKALVAKWKTMVVDEDTSECDDEDEACVPDAPESYSDHSNSSKSDKNERDQSSRNSSKHRSSESRDKSRTSEKHESRHSTKNSSSENSKPRENETKALKESHDERHKSTKNGGSEKKQIKTEEKSSKGSSTRESRHETSKRESVREDRSHRGSSSTSSATVKVKSEEERKSSSRVSSSSGNGHHSGSSKNRSKSRDSQRKRKLDSSSSERETSKKNKNLESPEDAGNVIDDNRVVDDDDDDDRPTQILLRDSDNESGKNQPDTCFDSESDDEILKKKIKREILDSPPSSERVGIDSRNAQKSEKSSKAKSRENTDKSSSNSSGKSRRDDEKREKSKTEGETSGHRKNEKRKDDTTRDQGKESSSKSKSHTKSSSSSKDHHHSGKDKEDLRKSSKTKRDDKSDRSDKDSTEKFKEPKDKKVKKKKINEDDGIDCNSGASFAEALGMCLDRPSSRKKNPVSPTSPLIRTIKSEPGTSSSSPMPSSSKSSLPIKSEFPSSNDSQALSLLAPNVKLEPLNVDLASTLPEISPNYKPLPAHYMNPLHRKQDEDKALSDVIYAKGQRTKVYSGNKSGYTSVPSLCEVCIRVLIQHMDALGFTGGIPYDILKPVLERAMPDQLFTLENYNPYLIEDTDSLWQFHCNREFREKQREEMESWRDMYMRCRDEREVKLKALTANIKESIDKSVPVRSTKMAYVDNFVKPPRNVLRNQARYGTAKSSTSSSDMKKKLILSASGNSATNIAVPPPPMSRMKSSSSSNGKKNKAPLMAKTLQLIKSRYKR